MGDVCCGLKVGQIVPDFELDSFETSKGDFGRISLARLMNDGIWTILFFYPGDFTFVCATEMADLADQYHNFKELSAEVISVSTDSKYVHLAWQREETSLENVKFPMAADTTGKVSKLFGVYDENTGLALRGTFIISPEGILRASEVNYYNVGRNSEELLRKLQANVYLAKHGAEVCPARWTQGAKTITPSAKIVGKVHEAMN
ncbi:MAG: peroxiredoxin [Nitrospirae bacterium]|nr:peroxiredoxin [Nitrospirota bacterium]